MMNQEFNKVLSEGLTFLHIRFYTLSNISK